MLRSTEAAKLDWNISELIRRIDSDGIDFNVSIQRGYVWNNKNDSLLIHSILVGYPISIFYFNRVDGKYEGLEGKQRAAAIYRFVKNDYKLHAGTPPVIDENGNAVHIARHKFNQLPEYLQNRIMMYGLIIYYFVNMTIDEKVNFFIRVNSGKPVTATDIARIKVLSRNVFLSLAKHPAIGLWVKEPAKRKFADEDILKNIWCMYHNSNPSLLNKDTSPILEKTEVTEEQKQELTNTLDYMHSLFEAVKGRKETLAKMRVKTHIVSLGYMAYLAIEKGISAGDYIERALQFFSAEGKTPTISEAYNSACVSGIAKPEMVRARMNEIKKALR